MDRCQRNTGVHTVTVASVPSVASRTLALEVLALQWDTLGCGVTLVVPSIAGVDQLRLCWLDYREEETQIKEASFLQIKTVPKPSEMHYYMF